LTTQFRLNIEHVRENGLVEEGILV
jgi:hypothetical protein